MKMVAAAKLRRSQEAIVNARPYAQKIDEVVGKIAATKRVDSKFFPHEKQESKRTKEMIVLITSDRGLCGGFNANISKKAFEYLESNKGQKDFTIVCVGRKGADFLKRRGYDVQETVLNLVKEMSFEYTRGFSEKLINDYFDNQYDELIMFYNVFKSALSQVPTQQTILPIQPKEELWAESAASYSKDYIYEPQPQLIVDQLLEKSIVMQFYKGFSESLASEHGARMNAMENATNNAGDIIRDLTLTYNNLRQAAITRELIEITSGAEAL
tara:strand:+ start:17190 stop:17999 length:810 start_codon:yes stop_codon:yes gene_type:complete